MMKSLVHTTLALGLLAGSMTASASVTWQNAAGGDLSDVSNWGVTTMPDAEDYFTSTVNGNLTLSKDYDGLYWLFFNKAAPFTLDLGNHTLTVRYRLHVEGGSSGSQLTRVYVTNGTVAMKSGADRIFIGDKSSYNQMFVSSGGKLTAKEAGYLYVGNNKNYNHLCVQNGGKLEAAVNLGNKAGGSSFTVTGADSLWTSEDARSVVIGDSGANCSLSILDGGKAAIKGDFRAGYQQAATGTKVTVGNRSVLELGGNASFGNSGSGTTVEIQSGGKVELTAANALYVGANSTASDCTLTVAGLLLADLTKFTTAPTWSVGANSCRSSLTVKNGGIVALTNAVWNLGNANAAKNNVMEIEPGGAMYLACPAVNDERFNVGMEGSSNMLKVNGGLLDAPGCAVILGGKLAGASNSFTVENGGVANLRRVIIGDKGPSNALCVSNASLTVSGSIDAGYSAVASASSPLGCTITVQGRDNRIKADYLRLRNDAALIFKMPQSPYAVAPIECNMLEAAPDARIQVDMAGELPTARDIPLITTASDIADTVIGRLKATAVVPNHTSLRFTPKSVYLHVSGSFTVILR